MKKWLPCLSVILLVLVTASCQKPEEVTLSKYFNAMKIKDNMTMSAMALEPMSMEFKSWKVLSIEQPIMEPYAVADLNQKAEVLKKEKEEQIRKVGDAKYNYDPIESEYKDARGKRKADLQKKLDEAKAALDAATALFHEKNQESNQLKNQIETEKNMARLSTGREEDLETLTGQAITTNVNVLITSASGEKEYVFVVRRYELTNPKTNKPFLNKNVIIKIAPKEEFQK